MCELEVNEETKLNMLLPSSQGQGLCVVALVSYLCQIQKKFMEEVGRITQQRWKDDVDRLDR